MGKESLLDGVGLPWAKFILSYYQRLCFMVGGGPIAPHLRSPKGKVRGKVRPFVFLHSLAPSAAVGWHSLWILRR